MTWKLVGKRWRWFLMVTLVGLVAATSWLVLTGETGSPTPRPPWIRADGTGDPSKLPDVVPIHNNVGTIVGWTYIPQVPTAPPADDESVELPPHIEAAIERGEFPVVWEVRPGRTHTYYENGIHIELDDAVADPLHRDLGDHPVFATKAEAEAYAATKR